MQHILEVINTQHGPYLRARARPFKMLVHFRDRCDQKMCAKNLESRLVEAFASLQAMSSGVDRPRMVSLERHGVYEVRLVEPPRKIVAEEVVFFVELFDHATQTSLESFGSANLVELEHVADELILDAIKLNIGSSE
jgi:hypothetical protein